MLTFSIIQVWSCDKCGHERQYGASPKPETDYMTAPLFCSQCGKCTEHSFVRLQDKIDAESQNVETDTIIPRSRRT
jgi:transcription elongation factor Elf1